jgi:hypothetical protein
MTTGHGIPSGKLWAMGAGTGRLLAGPVDLGRVPASLDVSPDRGWGAVANLNLHGRMEPSSISVVRTDGMIEVGRIETCTMRLGSRAQPLRRARRDRPRELEASPTDSHRTRPLQCGCHRRRPDPGVHPQGRRRGRVLRGRVGREPRPPPDLHPRNVRTVAEPEPGRGGTSPQEFEADRAEVIRLMDALRSRPGPFPPHPLFGPPSRGQWMRWAYLHTDHHLRQFGV